MSTLLDAALFRRVKLEAARRNKQISEIVAEALEQYFEKGGTRGGSDVVAGSWAALPLDARNVKRILEEEEVCLTLD